MNKKAVYGVLLALVFPVVCYFIVKQVSQSATVLPGHYIYDSITTRTQNGKLISDTIWHRIPDFNLKNHLNQHVSWKDIEGKAVIADFFFTHCPTICPRLTENMKRLQEDIRNSDKIGNRNPDFLQFLSFSVDPERDSVPELKKWADRFQINSNNWWLLTGDKKDIYDLSIEHMKLGLVDGKGIDTSFFHTDYMVLIDKNRHIRGYYHGLDTNSVKQLARDVIFLTLEKDPKSQGVFSGKLELIAVVFLLTLIGLGLLLYLLKRFK